MRTNDEHAPRRLLKAFNRDPAGTADEMFAAVYGDLRRMARRQLERESGPVTLNPTALVHEAFLRFSGHPPDRVEDQRHFVRLITRVMRQFLIDHARRRKSLKRGMEPVMTTFNDDARSAAEITLSAEELIALHEALGELAAHDESMAQVVEMRFFGGFTNARIAEVMGVSIRTVNRMWHDARAWLLTRLEV